MLKQQIEDPQLSLLASAEKMIPLLRSRSADREQSRRCPQDTIEQLKEIGLTRIVQPTRFGGFGMDWDVLCQIAMLLGRGCGAQGWTATVLTSHASIVGLFQDAAQQDVWANNSASLISTSFVPSGRALKVDGGFLLNGQWKFASGVHHKDWTIVGGTIAEQNETIRQYLFLVPATDRTLVDDWQVMGLAGTGSVAVNLGEVFVPEYRSLDCALVSDGRTPGAILNTEPVFRMPIFGFAGTALVSVAIGIAEGMVQEFQNLVRSSFSTRDKTSQIDAQIRLAEADAETKCARLLILATVRRNFEKLRAGNALDDADAALTSRDSAYAAKLCKHAASRLFEATGGTGLQLSGSLQRGFRDIHAATAHVTLQWARAASRFGERAYLQ